MAPVGAKIAAWVSMWHVPRSVSLLGPNGLALKPPVQPEKKGLPRAP